MSKESKQPEPGKPIKLSKSNIDQISLPGTYPDSELTGYKLWVGKSGVKSYQVVGKVKGKPQAVFVTIGKHGDPWTPESARKEAVRLRLLMGSGVNPNQQKKDERAQEEAYRVAKDAQELTKGLTLETAFHEFLEKNQKESTTKVYRWVFGKHFKDWLDRPLIEINQDDILKKFDAIHAGTPSSAAHAMRILRAVFLTAQVKHGESIAELARANPVKILSHGRKGWNTLEPRDEFIHDGDLPAFYRAVAGLKNETARDYLMVAILTGLRKAEICSLTWGPDSVHVCKKLEDSTITITDTKNGQKHMLAMSAYLYNLFSRRKRNRESLYVFPGKSKSGHFSDPEKPIKEVIKNAGIAPFSSHSLRRTFATAADALGYSLNEVQRLLNHKAGSIAERHYIQRQAKKTAEPMQRISDHLLDLMSVNKPQTEVNNVVPLIKASGG